MATGTKGQQVSHCSTALEKRRFVCVHLCRVVRGALPLAVRTADVRGHVVLRQLDITHNTVAPLVGVASQVLRVCRGRGPVQHVQVKREVPAAIFGLRRAVGVGNEG